MHFLVFHLHGPLASWGDIAVGEVRPSFPAPTRSALLGLLAACLGIPREAKDAFETLSQSLQFAVRVDADGARLDEYQTISLPEGRGHSMAPTRRVEEQYARENTMQTYRAHFTDALYTVFVRTSDAKAMPLETLSEALTHPIFTPYLGRKANPLDVPMCPKIIQCEDLGSALQSEESELPEFMHDLFTGTNVRPVRRLARERRVVADARFDHWPWLTEEQRNNEPESRTSWHFSTNRVRVGFDIDLETQGE